MFIIFIFKSMLTDLTMPVSSAVKATILEFIMLKMNSLGYPIMDTKYTTLKVYRRSIINKIKIKKVTP